MSLFFYVRAQILRKKGTHQRCFDTQRIAVAQSQPDSTVTPNLNTWTGEEGEGNCCSIFWVYKMDDTLNRVCKFVSVQQPYCTAIIC